MAATATKRLHKFVEPYKLAESGRLDVEPNVWAEYGDADY